MPLVLASKLKRVWGGSGDISTALAYIEFIGTPPSGSSIPVDKE